MRPFEILLGWTGNGSLIMLLSLLHGSQPCYSLAEIYFRIRNEIIFMCLQKLSTSLQMIPGASYSSIQYVPLPPLAFANRTRLQICVSRYLSQSVLERMTGIWVATSIRRFTHLCGSMSTQTGVRAPKQGPDTNDSSIMYFNMTKSKWQAGQMAPRELVPAGKGGYVARAADANRPPWSACSRDAGG